MWRREEGLVPREADGGRAATGAVRRLSPGERSTRQYENAPKNEDRLSGSLHFVPRVAPL
jgi:hypothetical protein